MKKIVLCIIAFSMILAVTTMSFAEELNTSSKGTSPASSGLGSNILTVKFNGKAVAFSGAQPYVDANSRTMLPLRAVAETMGADVNWDKTIGAAVIKQNGITIKVPIGSKTITVSQNGATKSVQMDTKAVAANQYTYLPIRYVAESLGAWVGYSDLFNTVQIYKDVLTPEEIVRLHGYSDMTWQEYLTATKSTSPYTQEKWLELYPQYSYFTGTGTFGFNNANEWLLRNPNKSTIFKGIATEATYNPNVQSDVEFSKVIMDEAIKGVEVQFSTDGLAKATFRTDLSCVYFSRHASNGAAFVRGVLTINVPEGTDIAAFEKKYGCTGIKAGSAYNADVEMRVHANPMIGKVGCFKLSALK